MLNFALLVAMAVFVFGVPLKGSLAALAVGALLYVTATTGYGLLISTFASTQIAALFGTAILTVLPATQFSGMLAPVSTLSGSPPLHGAALPDDLLPADQRRHLHQVTRASPNLPPTLLPLAALHPRADAAQPAAAAQAGAVMRDAAARQHLLARHQGAAQLRSHDFVLLGLVIYSFSLAIYAQAQSTSQELHNAAIAIVDEDHSQLSRGIARVVPAALFQAAAAGVGAAMSTG